MENVFVRLCFNIKENSTGTDFLKETVNLWFSKRCLQLLTTHTLEYILLSDFGANAADNHHQKHKQEYNPKQAISHKVLFKQSLFSSSIKQHKDDILDVVSHMLVHLIGTFHR